ncbi:hypothetical protein KDE13_09345 [Campylobacter sp. faydin G-140]|uniref:hypothetical protein n=1 Tax=Campylobacter anatolicus TaxID=2829105 RepID=UPI001B9480E1|nr:hypothetical protein [Campylobacter anatolicus]MBR8466538.1 hypothetical protein [Campylobacter anatolicus]
MFEIIEFRFLDFQKMIAENLPLTNQDIRSLIDFCKQNGKFINLKGVNIPPLRDKICEAFEAMQDDPKIAQSQIKLDYDGNLINSTF